jgi:hypothetical protein
MKMMSEKTQLKKLYLDDVRVPKTEGWTIVRNYDDFVEYITKNGLPDEISFDHDLGEDVAKEKVEGGMSKRKTRVEKKETKSGYDCAKWLCDYCWTNGLPIPSWNVHSANPVGRDNIIQILKSFEKRLND